MATCSESGPEANGVGPTKVVKNLSRNLWTFKDAPKPSQEILRITLKQKSYWETFKETVSPRGIARKFHLMKIESDKQKVLQDAYKRGQLTQTDVDFLNKCMSDEVREVFEEFRKKLEEIVKIEKGDTADVAMTKLKILEATIGWLEELIDWLHGKLTAILSKIDDMGPNWSIQRAEELFQELFDQFSKSDPELEVGGVDGTEPEIEQGVEDLQVD